MSSKSNTGMSSIARSINMEYWLRELSHFLLLDIVIMAAAATAFFLWAEGQLPEGITAAERFFAGDSSDYMTWKYVIRAAGGAEYPFLVYKVLEI